MTRSDCQLIGNTKEMDDKRHRELQSSKTQTTINFYRANNSVYSKEKIVSQKKKRDGVKTCRLKVT